MKNKNYIKNKLFEKLIQNNVFWSYDISSPDELPDKLIIEHTLRWADVPEILMLFEIYPEDLIKQVWIERLIPDERIYKHNWYLAKIFFDIDDPTLFIKANQQSRYERIAGLK